MFLRSKEETFPLFETFAKQVQVKYNEKIARIRLDYGTKFENAKYNQFSNELRINHNFSAPRTP